MDPNRVKEFVLQQPAYQSSEGNFELRVDHIFSVVDDIRRYCSAEISGRFYHGIDLEDDRPLAYIVGMGRRLEIVAPNRDPQQPRGYNIVNLGDLVLSEDGKKLILQIHALDNLLIDPKGIVDIARMNQILGEPQVS